MGLYAIWRNGRVVVATFSNGKMQWISLFLERPNVGSSPLDSSFPLLLKLQDQPEASMHDLWEKCYLYALGKNYLLHYTLYQKYFLVQKLHLDGHDPSEAIWRSLRPLEAIILNL